MLKKIINEKRKFSFCAPSVLFHRYFITTSLVIFREVHSNMQHLHLRYGVPDRVHRTASVPIWRKSGCLYRYHTLCFQSDGVPARKHDVRGHRQVPDHTIWDCQAHEGSKLQLPSTNGYIVSIAVRSVISNSMSNESKYLRPAGRSKRVSSRQ